MKEKLLNLHSFCKKYFIYYILVMVALLVFDLATKYYFEDLLLNDPNHRIEIIDGFFTLSLIYNPGAFSGFLGDTIVGKIILCILSLVCGIGMSFAFVKFYKKMNWFARIGLVIAIPGTFGNLVDRFLMVIGLQEGVIDFLEFDLGFMVWNTFNFADSYLVIGIIAFAIGITIMDYKKSKEEKKEELLEEKNEDSSNGEE